MGGPSSQVTSAAKQSLENLLWKLLSLAQVELQQMS